jgi:hypothetical protein
VTPATKLSINFDADLAMNKLLTRTEIGELLRPRPDLQQDELIDLTIEGLAAALSGIAAGEIPSGYSVQAVATAIGYLLAGCTEHAARATRQAVMPYALPAASRPASAAELLTGLAKLRSLLGR